MNQGGRYYQSTQPVDPLLRGTREFSGWQSVVLEQRGEADDTKMVSSTTSLPPSLSLFFSLSPLVLLFSCLFIIPLHLCSSLDYVPPHLLIVFASFSASHMDLYGYLYFSSLFFRAFFSVFFFVYYLVFILF